MKLVEALSAVLAFRSVPTTILLVLLYLTVFGSVFITDNLPAVPKNTRGLNLTQAYSDLHQITLRPHPYNSHSNELVRSYILSRLRNVTSHHSYAHISDDLVSNGSWASTANSVYFEGTNIVVKIDGSDPAYRDKGGVLFSAHYDSVSTAPGATDDGMGVATLMQLVELLVKERPRRTAVFNINNGEEDWLNGAHAFLEHPWANISDTFLNLEGAASGGRPLLFRATSTAPLLSFLSRNVPHPHGNVLSSDAFARGAIRSGTDYTVYTQGAGMEGIDLAFYRGRSKYHTKYDAIPQTDGQEKSLWAMMEAARGAGLAMVNDESGKVHGENGKGKGPAVYLDLFGAAFIVFPLSALYIFNVVLLVIGPVAMTLLIAFEHILQYGRQQQHLNGDAHRDTGGMWADAWTWFKELSWLKGMWRWAKFWVAIVLTVGFQVLLVLGYVKLNPFIVYSQPFLVVVSSFSLAYLTIVLTLNLPIARGEAVPEKQKQTVLLQTYILTWIFLVLATIAVGNAEIGGLYFISAWNAVVFIACALGCVEGMLNAKGTAPDLEVEEQIFVRGVRYDAVGNGEEANANPNGGDPEQRVTETEATEITPLMQQHRDTSRSRSLSSDDKEEEGGAIGWWILQMLIVVPLPVILVSHIAIMLMGSMAQTLSDGNSPTLVYAAASILTFLMVLPLAPFSLKLQNWLTGFILIVFVASTVYTWIIFPFSQDAPLKVFFQQSVTIDLSTSTVTRTTSALTGVSGYLDRLIIPKLPSAQGQDVQCIEEKARPGLSTCRWESSALSPSPGTAPLSNGTPAATHTEWLSIDTEPLGLTSARISVKGTNTKSCRLYFDNRHITRFHVHGSGNLNGTLQQGFEMPEGGLQEIRLWSRTWDRKFTVDVEWDPSDHDHEEDGGLNGRAACEWVEYESGTVGVEGVVTGKIPAYEEILNFLPKWAVGTKMTDGLVEVEGGFLV